MSVDTTIFGGSKARREVLRRLFARPGAASHVRELARETGYSAAVVGRELDRLERDGILASERIGRARRYRVDERSPIAAEVRSLVQKTLGIEATLRAALTDLAGVEEAFLFGSYARGEERPTSDIDLLVVGSVNQEQLSERLAPVERVLGRDVNVASYERAELVRLQDEGDGFVLRVLAGARVPLLPPPEPA